MSLAVIKCWLALGLILDAVVFTTFGELRERKWYFWVWLLFMILSGFGTLGLFISGVSAFNVQNDAAGGFGGLGLILIAGASLPYPLLLALCLRRRPIRNAKDTTS